jgi:hypothetical protein
MDVMQFIKPEVLVIVLVIYVIGLMLKGTKRIPDWLIPFILLAIAIMFCFLIIGFVVEAVIQAILLTALAVYGNQIFKQLMEGINKKPE